MATAEPHRERDKFVVLGPAYEKAWNKLDDGLYVAPSMEVFRHGYEEAKGHKYLTPEAYATQVIAQARASR